jgi:bleomycin hydrolase
MPPAIMPLSPAAPNMEPTLLIDPSSSATASDSGELTPASLAALRAGYRMNPADRARHNAVTGHDARQLALDRGVVRGGDAHFSHRVKSAGITNQKKSGRCWMFAALNVLRPQVIRDHRMDGFEFSTAYLQFWDKMEKANLYLESIIELRDADFLDRDWEIVNKSTVEDGGWWNYVAGLIEKYGVMPLSAMPETHASNHTGTLNDILGRLLRARAARMLQHHADGADIPALRAEKHGILAEVYRMLVIHFGEPPAEFDWRFVVRGKPDAGEDADLQTAENLKLSPAERHTPRSFYQKFVGRPLAEFVCLYNDPKNDPDRHYQFDRARNIVGSPCMNFVNIGMPLMKEIAKASILANEPLWFAVNMGPDQSEELGLMKHRLFDYEALFDIDLTLTKAERTRFHHGASGHAMALMGVDLDANGVPLKWLVENSWGDERGDKGLWTLHDDWFDEHVYTIIVHQRHVPSEVLARFEDEPTVLPAWYPGAGATQLKPMP